MILQHVNMDEWIQFLRLCPFSVEPRRNYHTAQSLLNCGSCGVGIPEKRSLEATNFVCPSRGFYFTVFTSHYTLPPSIVILLPLLQLTANSTTPPRRYSRNQEPRVVILLEAKLHEKIRHVAPICWRGYLLLLTVGGYYT